MTPYYESEGITIYLGDNVETMSRMESNSIDLVVTSPPYDNLRTYGGHSWDFEGVANQLWRLVKPGGVVVWVVADATIDGSETGTSFRQALRFKEIGFKLWDTMIWNKPNPSVPTEGRYYAAFEYMFVLSKGAPKTTNWLQRKNDSAGSTYYTKSSIGKDKSNYNGKKQKVAAVSRRYNVWTIKIGGDSISHRAIFPEALARDHILSWSNEGDTVLDPFGGSGTTAKMAKHNGRKCVSIEIEEKYCEIAAERLRQKVLAF